MITHKGTQTIYTERLTLRQFTVEDAQDMFENWASDERVAQKCGLTYEGIRREYYKSKSGEFLDLAEYSILRREWEIACPSN